MRVVGETMHELDLRAPPQEAQAYRVLGPMNPLLHGSEPSMEMTLLALQTENNGQIMTRRALFGCLSVVCPSFPFVSVCFFDWLVSLLRWESKYSSAMASLLLLLLLLSIGVAGLRITWILGSHLMTLQEWLLDLPYDKSLALDIWDHCALLYTACFLVAFVGLVNGVYYLLIVSWHLFLHDFASGWYPAAFDCSVNFFMWRAGLGSSWVALIEFHICPWDNYTGLLVKVAHFAGGVWDLGCCWHEIVGAFLMAAGLGSSWVAMMFPVCGHLLAGVWWLISFRVRQAWGHPG